MISKEPGEEAASASIAAFGASSAHCPVRLVMVAEQPVGLSPLSVKPECWRGPRRGFRPQNGVFLPHASRGRDPNCGCCSSPSCRPKYHCFPEASWRHVLVQSSCGGFEVSGPGAALDGVRRGAWQNGNHGRSQPPTPALAWGAVAAPTLLGLFLWEPAHPGYVIPALGSLLLPGLLCWEAHGHRPKGILVPWEAILDKLS